jgi:hypothetical protein
MNQQVTERIIYNHTTLIIFELPSKESAFTWSFGDAMSNIQGTPNIKSERDH